MSEIWRLGVRELRDAARRGDLAPVEVVDALLDRIATVDPRLGAFVGLDPDGARARARTLERGPRDLPLFGVPFAVKDNISVAGWPLSCASRILDGYRAPFHATAVERLLAAGAIPLGRSNLDEFGFGSSTEHSCHGPTRNPWDLSRIPGGSSGGSAAAVAARLVPFALGSDTGGSIRQPAALCGVVGLKPTYGRVSRFGLVAYGSSLDQIGPLTRDVADCLLVAAVIGGLDPRDPTSAADAPSLGDTIVPLDPRDLVLGVPQQWRDLDLDPEIRAGFDRALARLEEQGITTVPVSLPALQHALPAYYVVASTEAASNLARYDGIRYGRHLAADDLETWYVGTRSSGFGEEAQRRILLGTLCSSAGYAEAFYERGLEVRARLTTEFGDVLRKVDAVLGPTTPLRAFALGAGSGDPMRLYACDQLTTPANLCGLPAVSVPCGTDPDGLPIGLQLIGRRFAEGQLLAIARLACDSEVLGAIPRGIR